MQYFAAKLFYNKTHTFGIYFYLFLLKIDKKFYE